jgi:urease accessory protein
MFMMADSMFPIGSFAHSFGLEAAAQLGLFSSPSGGGTRQHVAVHRYLRAVLRSTIQQSIPLLRTARLANVDDDPALWRAVNDHADRLLSANPPTYRASIEQAKNLRRILDALDDGGGGDGKNGHRHWFNDDEAATHNGTRQSNCVVHLAPLWGWAATTTFGMTEEEACRAFVYTVARDLVSAAVRMNLLGPMEGQTVLWKDLLSATSTTRQGRQPWYDLSVPPNLDDATTAAPAVDAIQPCHDLLASRLFRS